MKFKLNLDTDERQVVLTDSDDVVLRVTACDGSVLISLQDGAEYPVFAMGRKKARRLAWAIIDELA